MLEHFNENRRTRREEAKPALVPLTQQRICTEINKKKAENPGNSMSSNQSNVDYEIPASCSEGEAGKTKQVFGINTGS